MRRWIVLILSLPALGQISWAQTAAPAPPVSHTFRLISMEGVDQNVYYFNNRMKIPVSISSFAKSDHYPLPAKSPIAFFRDGKNDKGQTISVPVGTASFDPHWTHPLFLVLLPTDPAGQITFQGHEEDPASFKSGCILLVNMTTVAVLANLSGHQVQIPPGQQQIIEMPSAAMQVVDAGVSVTRDDKWQPVYQHGWELEPAMRITGYIVQGADGRYRVRRLRENSSTFLPRKPQDGPKVQPVVK